jgi:branched-subunit amino acid permease
MDLLTLLVYLAVFVIVVILIWWLLQQITLPDPLGKILTIVLVVVAAVILIGILLSFTGHGGIRLGAR